MGRVRGGRFVGDSKDLAGRRANNANDMDRYRPTRRGVSPTIPAVAGVDLSLRRRHSDTANRRPFSLVHTVEASFGVGRRSATRRRKIN